MNDWRDRDRWGNERWRDRDDDDEYQRRHSSYAEAREYWRNTEPRHGGRPARHDPWRDTESSWYGSRYSGEYQNPYRRNYGRGLDIGEDYPDRYGQQYGHGAESHRGWWDRTKDEVRSWMGDEDAERRREADHYGRGPKGYTRSDDRIRDDVSDRLMEDWEVDASDIEVGVAAGEVTLTGTVGDRQSKRRAENLAANVLGVKDVQNNLRVRKIDAFATGREVASMTQGSSANTPAAGTATTPKSPLPPRH